jgi:integrase
MCADTGGPRYLPMRRSTAQSSKRAMAGDVELLHEGIPLPLIQRQLGHAYLSTTGTYLEGVSSEEIIGAVHGRQAPMMHASTGLEL